MGFLWARFCNSARGSKRLADTFAAEPLRAIVLAFGQKRTVRMIGLWFSMWGLSIPLFASNPTLNRYYHTSWSAKDGAPPDIQDMAQTTDGFLWLGTITGLYRFDGVHFEKFQFPPGEALQRDNIFRVTAAPDGGLWIGYYLGGLSFLKNGHITHFAAGQGLPASPAQQIVTGGDGSVWARLVDGSLMHLEGGQWNLIGKDWNFPQGANLLLADTAGALWAHTSNATFFLPKAERRFRQLEQPLPGVVAVASDGNVVILSPPSELSHVGGSARQRSPSSPTDAGHSFVATRDKDGMFWCAGSALLFAASAEELGSCKVGDTSATVEHLSMKDDMTGDGPTAIMLDREGNIWVSTDLSLDQFRLSAVVPVQFPPGSRKFSLASRDGNGIWATAYLGTDSKLAEITDGRIASQKAMPGAISVYRDVENVLWIGTYGEGKILRKSGDKVEEIQTASNMVGAMTKDRQGRLWALLSGKGYFRLDHGKWTSLYSLGAPEHGALISFTDSSGRIWFGYQGNRVVSLENEKTDVLSTDKGVQVGNVSTIQGGKGSVWIGGERGLEMFDGRRFQPLNPIDRTAFSNISAIVPTEGDGLWIGESQGIIHVPELEMRQFVRNPNYRVSYQTLNGSDGLPASLQPSYPAPAGIQTADGLIWFATASGLVYIDSRHLPKNELAPPVSIAESVVANGQNVYRLGSTPLELPPRTTSLQIAYTALSLSIPGRVRFRYRLKGQDTVWQEVGTRREAFYTNLGPGTYKFQVIACNNAGVWNETGATLDFTIAPAYYQTWWFRLSYVALALCCLWVLYLLRLNQATAQIQRRLEARMEERERIARELHDTLLQGFQGLVLRFQAVMKMLPAQEPAHQMMESVLDRADEVLLEGRQRVRDIREEGTTGADLSEALAQCGEELAREHKSLFSLTVVGKIEPIGPIVFDESYRIAREALINAFQHSHALKIEADITYSESSLCLSIRDDGDGIDEAILSRGRLGHWGLSGMRERAHKIGAQLAIWSSPGAGTEIGLKIPAEVAYQSGRSASLWNRFRRISRRQNEV